MQQQPNVAQQPTPKRFQELHAATTAALQPIRIDPKGNNNWNPKLTNGATNVRPHAHRQWDKEAAPDHELHLLRARLWRPS